MKYQCAVLITIVLMMTGCGTENKSVLDGLKIEYHAVSSRYINQGHILVYDPATGKTTQEEGNFWDRTDYPCWPTPYTPADYIFNDISTYPVSNSAIQAILEQGGWGPLSGHERPFCQPVACNKEKGLLATYCPYYGPGNRHGLQTLAIIDITGDSVMFVDFRLYDSYPGSYLKRDDRSYDRRSYDHGMSDASFDQKGDYLYYRKDTLALRFDVQQGVTDTLPHGETSVIPSNSSDIIVWSYMYTELRLLNPDMSVKSWVRTDFTSAITCYSLGDDAFLIGERDQWRMDVALYDFKAGTKTDLFEANAGQILGVRRD